VIVSSVLRTSENKVISVAKINYEVSEYSHTCSEVICMFVRASTCGEGEDTANTLSCRMYYRLIHYVLM
jgi:hypothetical protein